MTLGLFHIITKRYRHTVPYRRTGFSFGSEHFSDKVITQRAETNTFRKISRRSDVGSSKKWTIEQTGGNYIITLLRASVQMAYEFRSHLFAWPWE
jgi:hypothetical protein